MSKAPPTQQGASPASGGAPGEVKKRPPKGHRQKGAGTVVVSKGEVKRDGLEIKEWQQTPKQLLLNYCKAEKRPPPRYVSAGGAPAGRFLVRVILPDPKDQKEKDIVVVPRDSSFESVVEAEHAVALLALQKVDGARSHELKLPEPYRSAWLKLVGRSAAPAAAQAAASADEFTCEDCGKGFSKAHALEHHRRTTHPKPKKGDIVPGEVANVPAPVATTPIVASSSSLVEPAAAVALPPASSSVLSVSPAPEPSPPLAQSEKKDTSGLMQLKSKSAFATEHERQAHFERMRVDRERHQRQKQMRENNDEDYVFMSEENRAAIESIVREAAASSKIYSDADAASADDGAVRTDEDELLQAASGVIGTLVKKMGFSRTDANSAILNGEKGADLSSALDWLLVHVPEDRLPTGFDPRGMQLEVTVLSSKEPRAAANDAKSNATSTGEAVPSESDSDASVFTWYHEAFNVGLPDSTDTVVGAEAEGNEAEWRSEWEALESTLGADARIVEAEASPYVKLLLKVGENPQLGPGSFTLEFRFHRATYPSQSAPVAILRGFPLTSGDKAYVCAAVLAEKAMEHKGEQSAFTLWDFACHMSAVRPAKALASRTAATAVYTSAANGENGAEDGDVYNPKRRSHHGGASRPSISKAERLKQSEDLMRHLKQKRVYDSKSKKKALPAHGFRSEIVNAVNANRVVIIKGETGCGKTTQVPQFIFEDFIERSQGGFASLVVTQPRRLAAVSVATRVAGEFGEDVGNVVGYRVQLESKAHPVKTRLEFVTTGLLLRRLQGDSTLREVTHVIVDEVHERSLDSDFLLALLRECLKKNANLKVVLMSATMDAQRFSAYFGGVPVLEIPGFTYPVQEFFLEDVLRTVPFVPPNFQHGQKSTGKGEEEEVRGVVEYLERDVDYNFVAQCVQDCHRKLEADGSILVFMSGVSEISRTIKACEAAVGEGLYLLPLHGALSGPDQRKVFERAPHGKRKVVVATNVAETSVTIDDIVCVIDSGRMKEMRFDAATKMSSLVDTWVSLASARQRKGRAGRVRQGICIKLFSKSRRLEQDQLAEVHRVPLEQCVLQVASMGVVQDLPAFFESLVDPPALVNVTSAMDSLVNIGALQDRTFELLPLGSHLAKLPMDVRLAKMLIFGSLLGVPEDVATVAAALSRRSPFLNPPSDKRDLAKDSRKALAAQGVANGAQSDHLILVTAFELWKACKGERERRRFSSDHFLSDDGLREMDKLRREFLDSIEHIGFSRRNETIFATDHPLVDLIAKKRRLIKASLCAGLYPNVIRIKRPSKRYVETHSGALEAQATAKELSFHLVGGGAPPVEGSKPHNSSSSSRVFLHPSSINFEANAFNSSWMVYSEVVQTTKAFARDCTVVAPYGLLLFGGALEAKHEEGLILCGRALKFKASPRIAVLIKEIKKLLDRSLADKISNPNLNISGSKVLDACKRLIEGDGFF